MIPSVGNSTIKPNTQSFSRHGKRLLAMSQG